MPTPKEQQINLLIVSIIIAALGFPAFNVKSKKLS